MADIGNVEFCLDYYIQISEEHKFVKQSAIIGQEN